MTARYNVQNLTALATHLLQSGGLNTHRAAIVADTLIEADLLGFSTHGLNLLPAYLQELADGRMASSGDPTILSDHGTAMTWDGKWLPGAFLVRSALDMAYERIERSATVTIVIRRSAHIGCLATYAQAAAQRGYFLLLTCADPSVATVAPHGAVQGRMTPNPIAAGWPTVNIPVVLDVCPASTTNRMVARYTTAGELCPGEWLIDSNGNATRDPNAMTNGGAILPVGGIELGHKGFALGLLVEALTSALSGSGRSNPDQHAGASVFMLLINPAMFGGATEFKNETQWMADSCRSAKPRPGGSVRMPGERSHAARQSALRDGVELHPQVISGLKMWAEKMGHHMPTAI